MKTKLLLGLATAISLATCQQYRHYENPSPKMDNYNHLVDDTYTKKKILKEIGYLELLKITSGLNP